ncbi:MAG: nucleotidyl transferase AbiEii/AbiGii toxin family protein [Oscillospiraceae bacterium]|nr:nucleotidyl transferase AbiEii/AbiGii toxin family protein [Ruminococcus sp.]MCD8346184.1 nucleotidyl transferase AbiEii/AbiGii toxin family protein [Oscillospiraceae bacterium]
MMLHDDKELFSQVVLRTSESLNIRPEIVEKDYYVTLLLKEIYSLMPEIVFKGGTSLSKCYHLIKRFSEDIDLGIEAGASITESGRKRIKDVMLKAIEKAGLELDNADSVKSRHTYNRYIVNIPNSSDSPYLKDKILIETAVYQKSYPTKLMEATSLIYDYLSQNGFGDFVEQYELQPVTLKVQAAERTLVDKLYALADYYLAGTLAEHSRHIYDIYKLLSVVTIDDNLKVLAISVADERRPDSHCISVQDGVNVQDVLTEVIRTEAYRNDYEEITEKLLYEPVSYDKAISGIQEIVDGIIFRD